MAQSPHAGPAGEPARFALPPRITLDDASAVCRDALGALRAAAPQGPWLIDAAALTEFDSSCLALLLELRRACGALQLRGVPPRLRQLVHAYGVETLFDA